MPRVKRRAKSKRRRSEATDHCIACLDLPSELRAELLGVPEYSDYVIRTALDHGWESRTKPAERELRATWLKVEPCARQWYEDNRPGEQLPDEPWRREGDTSE